MATASLDYISNEMRVRKELDVRPGDTVRVYVKIVEKGKTRTQIFQGLVLSRKHGTESGGSITVRKVSNGVGVERIFPIYSPALEKIEVLRRSRVRQSKLYYIRTKVAREIRRKMRNFVDYFASTDDFEVPAEVMEEEAITVPEETEATEETVPESEAGPSEEVTEETPQEEEKVDTEEASK